MALRGSRWKKHDEREEAFLTAFYADDSPTKGNKTASALAAGYAESTALDQSTRVFRKYNYRKFQEALAAVGINNLMMAFRVRRMIEEGADKDALQAMRLALSNKGEITDTSSGGLTVNSTAPVMVIMGASSDRMKALKTGAHQPTREELEEAENQRCQDRLDMLKAGKLPLLPSKSRARDDEEVQICDEPGSLGGSREQASAEAG